MDALCHGSIKPSSLAPLTEPFPPSLPSLPRHLHLHLHPTRTRFSITIRDAVATFPSPPSRRRVIFLLWPLLPSYRRCPTSFAPPVFGSQACRPPVFDSHVPRRPAPHHRRKRWIGFRSYETAPRNRPSARPRAEREASHGRDLARCVNGVDYPATDALLHVSSSVRRTWINCEGDIRLPDAFESPTDTVSVLMASRTH